MVALFSVVSLLRSVHSHSLVRANTVGMCLLAVLFGTQPAFGATATTTALTTTNSSGATVTTVASGAVVTLTATVTASGTAVTRGQVRFCNAAASRCTDNNLLAVAQLTSAGKATYRFRPSPLAGRYTAVFVGTGTYSPSTSSVSSLSVTGTNSSTSIAQSGSTGNYTLTATVTGNRTTFPTGTVSFLDTSNSNWVLGTATLNAGTSSTTFTKLAGPLSAARARWRSVTSTVTASPTWPW